MNDAKLRRGWSFPLNSRKAHYFPEGELRSLCGKWLFVGAREDDNHDSRDNCAECKRRRTAHTAQASKLRKLIGEDESK